MKKILAIAFVLISISTPTLFAKEWFCEYEEPNYRATRGIKVVGDAIIDILDKYKNWKAIVIGDEEREKIIFKHPRLRVIGFKNNIFILIDFITKVIVNQISSRYFKYILYVHLFMINI